MPFWRRRPAPDPAIDPRLWAVVGLGNPGGRYEGTRHNMGFMVVRHFAERHGLRFRGSKQRADVARGVIAGVPVLLALPVTYMNESGNAVSRLVQYYHVPVNRLLVVCDDMDLPFGTLRLRPDGSSGGQRGLESIIEELRSRDFPRLRVGVGRPAREAVRHVLSPFPPEQARLVPGLLDLTADAVSLCLTDGVEVAMNRYNRSWLAELEGNMVKP